MLIFFSFFIKQLSWTDSASEEKAPGGVTDTFQNSLVSTDIYKSPKLTEFTVAIKLSIAWKPFKVAFVN